MEIHHPALSLPEGESLTAQLPGSAVAFTLSCSQPVTGTAELTMQVQALKMLKRTCIRQLTILE